MLIIRQICRFLQKINNMSFPLVAKTLAGLEEVLASELKKLGQKNIEILTRAVGFEGELEDIYKTNYLCRTALRILKPIAEFPCDNENELYDKVKAINWDQYLSLKTSFAIDGFVANSKITHSYYTALKSKDAIADYFVENHGKRPSVDTRHPDIQLNVHITNDVCTVSLDSSGDSLHKRGYRLSGGLAPVNEVLASGLIALAQWDRKTPLLDPFCGSGTILMEAAMISQNIPAGYYRKHFSFENWPGFDSGLWEKVKENANSEINEVDVQISGGDKSAEAVILARKNIRNARLHKDIWIVESAFEKFSPPAENGLIITNPPYGERIRLNDITSLYKMIGNTLKSNFTGWNAWVLSSDANALKMVGLKPSIKYDVFNGKLQCKFAKFELYKGSRKATKEEGINKPSLHSKRHFERKKTGNINKPDKYPRKKPGHTDNELNNS